MKKDKNTKDEQDVIYEEDINDAGFVLDFRMKAILIAIGVASIALFVLFYKDAGGQADKKGNEVAVEESAESNKEKIENIEDVPKDDSKATIGGTLSSFFKELSPQPDLPEGKISTTPSGIIELEESWLYYNGDRYQWIPMLKAFSDKALLIEEGYTDTNSFGRIKAPYKTIVANNEDISDEDLAAMKEQGYIGLSKTPISDEYISHFEIVEDGIIRLVATSFQDYDGHVFVREDIAENLEIDLTSLIEKNIEADDDVYFIDSVIDTNFQERTFGLERKKIKDVISRDMEPISSSLLNRFSKDDSSTRFSQMFLNVKPHKNVYGSAFLLEYLNDSYLVFNIYDFEDNIYKINKPSGRLKEAEKIKEAEKNIEENKTEKGVSK